MRSNHRVRKMSLRRTISAALPLFLIVASFVTPLAAAQAADSPTIASDKADYAPGELVTLTGTGWTGDTTVNIEVNDTLGKSWQHIVDVPVVDGNITDSFNLPDRFVSDYDVTAKGLVNGIATTTFTDAVSTDYQHWLDDDADWSNTTLQQTNSSYKEGEVVPHVYDIKGGLSPSTSYSLRIFIRLQVGHEEHLRLLGSRYIQRRPTGCQLRRILADDRRCDTRWRRVGQLLHGERACHGCEHRASAGALAEAAVRRRDLHDGSWDRRQD